MRARAALFFTLWFATDHNSNSMCDVLRAIDVIVEVSMIVKFSNDLHYMKTAMSKCCSAYL